MITVTIMKKQKIKKLGWECLKTWVGIFQVGIFRVGVFLIHFRTPLPKSTSGRLLLNESNSKINIQIFFIKSLIVSSKLYIK